MVTFWVPLFLAVAGAAFGAYFAIIKTKREKLWVERYERLGSALKKTNLIYRFLASEQAGEYQSHGLTNHEKDQLAAGWPIARYELATDVVMLRMMFPAKEFSSTDDCWSEMEVELYYLIEEASSHDTSQYIDRCLAKTAALEDALISLSRKKCLGWF